MAAVNLKKSDKVFKKTADRFRSSIWATKTWAVIAFFSCLIATMGLTILRLGEILNNCSVQNVAMTSSGTFSLHIQKVIQNFLLWSGIQQVRVDITDEQPLCSENWINILFFIFSKELPENIFNYLNYLKKSAMHICVSITDFCWQVIQTFFSSLPSLKSDLFILLLFLLLVIVILIKTFLWKQNNDERKESSSKCEESKVRSVYNSLQLTPLTEMKRKGQRAINKRPFCYGYSFLCHGMVLLIMSVLFISIPWEFLRLYQKAVAVKAAHVMKGLPSHCTQHSMSWLKSILYILRFHFSWSNKDNSCLDYYYASFVDPLWEVNPLVVLSSVFTQGIVHPLEIVSASLGRSLRVFFSEIPAQWQPLIMFFAVISSLALLLMMCRYRLSIPLFLKIEPQTPVTSPSDKEKSRKLTNSKENDFSLPDDDCQVRLNLTSTPDYTFSNKNTLKPSREFVSTPKYADSNQYNLDAFEKRFSSYSRKNLVDGLSATDISCQDHQHENNEEFDRKSKRATKSMKRSQEGRR